MSPQSKARSKPQTISLEEYFEMEMTAETRHEFWNGEIRAMAYTSEEHGDIVSNLTYLLKTCLKGKDCKVIPSDRMVYIPSCNKVYCPDVAIVCGEREYYDYSKNMKAWLNPTIIIEVLSVSTKNDDRIDKWDCYRRIKSLQQYIMIDQTKFSVEILTREKENSWNNRLYENSDDEIFIGECKVALNEIYEGVEGV